MAQNSELKEKLFHTSSLIPIRIRRWKTDLLTVYITKCTSDGIVWARSELENQDIRIFPTRHVEILKIGSEKIKQKKELSAEFEAYLEYEKEKRRQNFLEIYRGAVKHMYELGDGEPVK